MLSLEEEDADEDDEDEQCLIRRGRLNEVRWEMGGGDASRVRERVRVYVKDGMVLIYLCRRS